MAGMKIKKKFHRHHQNICLDDERGDYTHSYGSISLASTYSFKWGGSLPLLLRIEELLAIFFLPKPTFPSVLSLEDCKVCSLSRGDKRSCFMSAVKSMTHKEEYLRTGWRRKLQTCFSQFLVLTLRAAAGE
ncbi:unnamed protein product [Sphagnum compactum]